ncbi:MAG: hypothetical protein HC902_07680 [Calothrix sp. SM1_5_4]|nr:hypothetical protein [Calothrix sp. SM1_5_4]
MGEPIQEIANVFVVDAPVPPLLENQTKAATESKDAQLIAKTDLNRMV